MKKSKTLFIKNYAVRLLKSLCPHSVSADGLIEIETRNTGLEPLLHLLSDRAYCRGPDASVPQQRVRLTLPSALNASDLAIESAINYFCRFQFMLSAELIGKINGSRNGAIYDIYLALDIDESELESDSLRRMITRSRRLKPYKKKPCKKLKHPTLWPTNQKS